MIQPKGKTNTHIPGLQTIKNWFERVGPFGPTPIGMVQDYVYRLIAPEGQAIAIKGLILERRPNCTVYLKVGGALETIFPSEVWCPLLCEIPNLQNDRIARGVRRLAGTPEGFPPVKVIAPQDLTPEVARVLPVFIKLEVSITFRSREVLEVKFKNFQTMEPIWLGLAGLKASSDD